MRRSTTSPRRRALGTALAVLCLLSAGSAAVGTICEMSDACPMMGGDRRSDCHEGVSGAMECCSFEGETMPPETPAGVVSAFAGPAPAALTESGETDPSPSAAGRRAVPPARPPSEGAPLYTLHSAYLI